MLKHDPDMEKERHMQQNISKPTTISFLSKKILESKGFRNRFL